MAENRLPDDRLTWPPAGDDLEVMDLEAESPGRSAPTPGGFEGDENTEPPPDTPLSRATPDDGWPAEGPSWPPARPGAFGLLRSRLSASARPRGERIGLAILALLVLAQAIFIAVWVLRDRPPQAGGEAVAATAGTAGTAAGAEAPASAPAGDVGVGASGSGPPTGAAAVTGYLAVRTQPPGAAVFIDGKRVGQSPVTVPDIEPGDHAVMVQSGGRTIRHTAQISPGEVVSLVIPVSAASATPAAAAAGSVSVSAPVELRVEEGDRLLGTSEMESIPLGTGSHTLRLRNEEIGYEATRNVNVSAGRTTTIEVEMPEERVAINAIPWAEVLVDGTRVGETPIGSLALPLGPHDLVLRHPQFGEKTVRAVVKAGEPTRISVDMRK